MTTTTQTGVANAAPSFEYDEADAANEFLSRWSVEDPENPASEDPEDEDLDDEADEPVEEEAEEDPEETDESEEDPQDPEESDEEQEDEGEEVEEEEQPKKKGKVLDDEAKVKLKVDDEEIEVSVKDLKRLYGQEAALTKKSQAVAEQRKAVEEANQKAAAQLDRLHQKAMARWEPYSKIDMLVASKTLDAESFAALRAEAAAAYEEVRFITQEVDQFVKNTNEQRQKQMKEAAVKSVDYLQKNVQGWNDKTYDEVRAYAVSKGMPEHVVNGVVDHFALEMMYKAMKFDKAKTVVTKKVNKTPAKVLKTTKAVSTSTNKVDKAAKIKQRLAKTGSTEDAADLFLARWS